VKRAVLGSPAKGILGDRVLPRGETVCEIRGQKTRKPGHISPVFVLAAGGNEHYYVID
jgi:hypothetical protein